MCPADLSHCTWFSGTDEGKAQMSQIFWCQNYLGSKLFSINYLGTKSLSKSEVLA